MDVARAYGLLTRAGLSGYDEEARTFRPWHRLARYEVRFRSGKGIAHLIGGSIVLSDPSHRCAHVVLHDFVHEAAHAQLLFLDIGVLVVVLSSLAGAPWYGFVAAILGWQVLWRELAADLYAAAVLGPRNTWLGYAHLSRRAKARRELPRGRGDLAGEVDVSR